MAAAALSPQTAKSLKTFGMTSAVFKMARRG
jgi:hypothetical protein